MRLPSLPQLLKSKIYKTGQTRGADDDQIFQNRVGRNSTTLIPFSIWQNNEFVRNIDYEKGVIVLISPTEFFKDGLENNLNDYGLQIGINTLVFYEKRDDWENWPPQKYNWIEASSRIAPLNGQFVARIANTTAKNSSRLNVGYTTTGLKGAGIRQYEYAPLEIIKNCRTQLEAIFWLSHDAEELMQEIGLTKEKISIRKSAILKEAKTNNLLDLERLKDARIINNSTVTVCPLCLEPLSSSGFISKLIQAAGRERHDLTVTEINLFHIKELAYGELNHTPYNLGWGHHHCNVVCKDAGIKNTLDWMSGVLERNSMM